MYWKIFLNFILIVALAILQLSFISGLPSLASKFNFILLVLVFILMLKSFKLAVWWAIGLGWLLDIYSFSIFGVYLISLFLTILIINFLLVNFFTDRSLYSFLAITFLIFVFYNIIFYLIIYLIGESARIIFSQDFWLNFGQQLVVNMLAALFLFYLVSFMSKRLKPVFLSRIS